MIIWLIYSLSLHFSAIHSLKYLYTQTSGIPNIPEFVAHGMVDDLPITRYDISIQKVVPMQQWMKENLDQQYWEEESQLARTAEKSLEVDIHILMERFNHTLG